MSVVLSDIGLTFKNGYQIQELFDGKDLGFYKSSDKFAVMVNPSGMVH